MTDSEEIKRILLVNLFGIGDVILSTPAVKAIRKRYPNAYIGMLVRNPDAVKNNPNLNEIIEFKNYADRYDFDMAVLLVYSPLSTFAVRNIKIKTGYVYDYTVRSNGISINNLTWKKDHLINLGRCVAQAMGCIVTDDAEVFPSKNDFKTAKILMALPKPVIVINHSSKIKSKAWSVEKIIELIPKLKGSVVLIGGSGDVENSGRIERACPEITNYTGNLTLMETAAVLKDADLFITHDSGPMHMGFAMNTPIIALFGYTDPSQIFIQAENRILLYKKTECSPHFKVGFNDYKYEECKTKECMETISVGDVLSAVKKLSSR